MKGSLSDRLHAGSDLLAPTVPPAHTVRRRAERRRRHRWVAAVVTPALLAAMILGWGATGRLRDSANPAPTSRPGPGPHSAGVLMPYLWGSPVRPGLSQYANDWCIGNPLTWGAATSAAGTFGSLDHPDTHFAADEFVLRYTTVAQARRAFSDAWHQSTTSCGEMRWQGPASRTTGMLSQWFIGSTRETGIVAPNVLRVARRDNVVVVLVDHEGFPAAFDRPRVTLWRAMSRATRNP